MDAGSEERRRGAYERLGILAWALTALVLVSTFLGGLYRVDGVSMEPTLEDGEVMVVCAVGRGSGSGGHSGVPEGELPACSGGQAGDRSERPDGGDRL